MPNTGNTKTASNKPVIFIDRDGVINEDPIGDYIKRWSEFRFIRGAVEGLKRLSDHGFEMIVISNQAGIGDGIFQEKDLEQITRHMLEELKKNGVRVARIYYCLHGKEEGCDCRKPKTGLFEQAAKDFNFSPSETYFIGDKLTDLQAGKHFGLRTIFVLTGHGIHDRPKITSKEMPEVILPSLKEAADYLLKRAS